MVQCFKSKPGTHYDLAVKKYIDLVPKWGNVIDEVAELLAENVTKIAFEPKELWVDSSEIKFLENRKLFTKDGRLKSNTKRAKEIRKAYLDIVESQGLTEFRELRMINFSYGVMRSRGQKLESYISSEGDIYFRADFDLAKRSDGSVESITEVQYQEKYLKELKKNEK
ncbi:hypothetical protein FZC76_21765 [Sutcliffiella horikoshii]|uniref:Uncharacterized protein n=1 Tax=Sutcliffiella horikoshii TaxID=79883 RepID=A0A5D4SCY0_9BACI|nr:hypothetical protein [Sutcliffiella horikoshii]TYS60501.1 hypothetical protein FZC76_21765 [Sutcliffiella horikoshii]